MCQIAGVHATIKCDIVTEQIKCANCLYSKKTYHTTRDVYHFIPDTRKWDILKNKINQYIASTDYPLQSTGKIENIINQSVKGNDTANSNRKTLHGKMER